MIWVGAIRDQLIAPELIASHAAFISPTPAFESAALRGSGVDFKPVPQRCRSTYFSYSAGDWFRRNVLSVGGGTDAVRAFRTFRGRDADVQPLLVRRGLAQ